MNITLFLLTDVSDEQGKPVKTFNMDTGHSGKAVLHVRQQMEETARSLFGDNMRLKADQSIWGGHYYDRNNGDTLIAR